jgi:hypothetical protein
MNPSSQSFGTPPSNPGRATLGAVHRLRHLAFPVCLFAVAHGSVAQQPNPTFILAAELPMAPLAQVAAARTPGAQAAESAPSGSITGTVVDRDGDSIPGARVILTQLPPGEAQLSSGPGPGSSSDANATPRTTTTAADGSFGFSGVAPGRFKITVSASGFAPRQTSDELQPGEGRDLAAIALLAGSSTEVQVTATQTEIAEAQINEEEKQRVLAVFPNFYVSYIPNPVPLNPKQKFEIAYRTLIDPVSLVLNGITAGVQQANNTYSWGQGAQGFGKRYAAAYGTFLNGTLIGNVALPILLKQDPRYYYKGTGSIRSRFFYAVANAVICKGDNGHWQVNYSAILGGIAAGGISNLYYPAVNRSGAGLTFEGAAIGTGISAVSNVVQEFLVRKLTPHIPPNPPANP